MPTVVNIIRVVLCSFSFALALGCGDEQNRQVSETSEMSFEDVADRIEQESAMTDETPSP